MCMPSFLFLKLFNDFINVKVLLHPTVALLDICVFFFFHFFNYILLFILLRTVSWGLLTRPFRGRGNARGARERGRADERSVRDLASALMLHPPSPAVSRFQREHGERQAPQRSPQRRQELSNEASILTMISDHTHPNLLEAIWMKVFLVKYHWCCPIRDNSWCICGKPNSTILVWDMMNQSQIELLPKWTEKALDGQDPTLVGAFWKAYCWKASNLLVTFMRVISDSCDAWWHTSQSGHGPMMSLTVNACINDGKCYLTVKTTSECKKAFAVMASELFNYWITQMKTDAEKKKGFSPEEKKQREGVNVMELLVWIRNNWWAKRHHKKVANNGSWLHCIGYRMVLPRMDAYKGHIEEYANQYLEASMLGELEKAKLAYAEGHLLTENIGEMEQEEEPDWIYFAMEPLEHGVVKEEIAKLQAERNSEPVRQQYVMLRALKALDANCHNMFKKFGMLTYSIAVFLDPKGNLKFTSADTGQLIFKDNLIKDKQLKNQQVVALDEKRFGKADDPTAVDNDILVNMLDSQIQLSKNADGTPILPLCIISNVPLHSKIVKQTLQLFLNAHYFLALGQHDMKVPWRVLSQHCKEAVVADYLPTAPMFNFGQPHNTEQRYYWLAIIAMHMFSR
ncbi:hypothetical protein BDN71DRAFT_1426719 [Pleurotus eryngii]|uniref:Uncharacterized protein n=1 Tax=Pleurotus eryngii TaxID=5323 RepID=A0A9P6DJK5_PLEER|nr:hypothetical protein BDN71DRAFT_1426719 [Pleurotus eryngii]